MKLEERIIRFIIYTISSRPAWKIEKMLTELYYDENLPEDASKKENNTMAGTPDKSQEV